MAVVPFKSACFFSTDNGATVQRRASAAEESGTGALPPNVTNLFRFDEKPANNAALLAAWVADSSLFSMVGNTVYKRPAPGQDPQAAGFDPPGLLFRALQNAAALWAKLENGDALNGEEHAQVAAISFSAKGLFV